MPSEAPSLPAGFDFPTCQQAVLFTGQYVYGRAALGRCVLGLPSAARVLLRMVRGDTMLANRFWGFHEAGLEVADWNAARVAILRAKPRVPAVYAVKILDARLASRLEAA